MAQLNYPIGMPVNVTHRVMFIARHGFFVRFESDKLKPCLQTGADVVRAVLSDIYTPSTHSVELCTAQPDDGGNGNVTFAYESRFHSLTLAYTQLKRSPSIVLGHVRAVLGKLSAVDQCQ